ncbi:serpentine type 7TM GPCR chemoreceptor srt domain-containing protein [Ditylenchus destructor]|uniref:Serpentine type 7TM GPCR chemoreceptor srt domain-containing protein n=1 Tax=Ditylenchus destructor TaxID=166010 RepID=A0AAD4R986_9BILA|nr:serpentine type 7TM GPCR chemoreceptor srt domain-containing protein [Ditylenchus destructor]
MSTLNAWEISPPKNNFDRFPTLWKYDSYYDTYCTNGLTVLSAKNVVIGSLYILAYLFFFSIYAPVLIVIRRSQHLYQYTSYKLMFGIGIVDNISGFVFTFMAGVMSITGINYCDNNAFVVFMGRVFHGCWGTYSMLAVILALNRCIEMFSRTATEFLFGSKRLYLWSVPIFVWWYIFVSNWDLPPIYSSYFNTWIFAIDLRPDAPPVIDWICFFNSWFVVTSLTVLYSLLFYGMHRKSRKCAGREILQEAQKKVFIQTFWICCSVFVVVLLFGLERSPGIVYILVNKTIRKGVVVLICGSRRISDSRSWQLKGTI